MRKAWILFLSAGTFVIVPLYIASCFTPYINQVKFWPFSFLSLGFPLLALLYLSVVAAWLVTHRKVALVLFLLFFAGIQNLVSIFAFNLPSTFNYQKDSNSLRVLDWNVRNFITFTRDSDAPNSPRRKMLHFIKSSQADVLLLQEFSDSDDPFMLSNTAELRDSLGYRYVYVSPDKNPEHVNPHTIYGCAIFSKYPLSNFKRRSIVIGERNEGVISADLTIRNQTMRLVTMHLISLELGPPEDSGQFYGRVNKSFLLNTSRMHHLKYYDSIHGRQANVIRQFLDESKHPVIASGDFNSVPSSFTYHHIKGKLQDCFLKKGSGFGRTYVGLSPTLRIDYIFADPSFTVHQYTSPALFLSDHFPLLADIKF